MVKPLKATTSPARVYTTDWLASRPVFYHEITGNVSHNINDVINFSDLSIDPDGFNNYLKFGYSVFNQTPVRHVKMLPHSSTLLVGPDNTIEIETASDPVNTLQGAISTERDVLELIHRSVYEWEMASHGEIVIPMTGGYDSRLLAYFISDKSRIRAFTFGRSKQQSRCREVCYANRLSSLFGINWEQIELEACHRYYDTWYRLFGPSINSYHIFMEFFHTVAQRVYRNSPILSGIVGDAWAGSVHIPEISSPDDLTYLGYTDWVADATKSRLKAKPLLAEEYFEKNAERLASEEMRIVEAIRFKMVFLSLLLRIPEFYGFLPWSPFLMPEVAMAMLSLPRHRRAHRAWQRDFFEENGLDLENMEIACRSETSGIMYRLMRQLPSRALLSVSILKEVIEPDYVEWINRNLARGSSILYTTYYDIHHIFDKLPLFWRLGRNIRQSDQRLHVYYAYTILKPIENLLRKREEA